MGRFIHEGEAGPADPIYQEPFSVFFVPRPEPAKPEQQKAEADAKGDGHGDDGER